MGEVGLRSRWKRWGIPLVLLYLVLLVVSHLVISGREASDGAAPSGKEFVEIEGARLAYLDWGTNKSGSVPLILLHGSPGSGAADWSKFASAVAREGRRVIAIDRWGYGDSEPAPGDYSFEADRRAVLGLMDDLGIERAHVGGWSYGGAPAILLGREDAKRILSVTMIGSIGIQEGEGSGSYFVEHAKYRLLYPLAVWLPEAIPHFGVLGTRKARRAFARDFMDCDQRVLRTKLATMQRPLLILHGKHDPLVPAWVASEHYEISNESRLVILDASHFFTFGLGDLSNFNLAVEEVVGFLEAVEAGRVSKLTELRNETEREDLRALWNGGPALRGYKPWFPVILASLVFGLVIPRTGGVLAGLAAGLLLVDFVTAITGVILGAVIRRGESRTRYHKAGAVLGVGIVGAILGGLLLPFA